MVNLIMMKTKVEVLNLLRTRKGNKILWPIFNARGRQRSGMSTQKEVLYTSRAELAK